MSNFNQMKHIIDKIESVTLIGETEQDFYDVGMEDTPHTFFANDILVHNSCFTSALPIIEATMPDVDTSDEEQMTKAILDVCGKVQLHVNKTFDVMAKRMFNVTSHRFDAKQEVIAKTAFWLVKKRYAQFIINENGVVKDEMDVKGIDVVRTSFPMVFREFMEQFLDDMLRKVDKSIIDKKILQLVDTIDTLGVVELAKNTSVKFISRDGRKNYNPETRHPFNYVLGTPAQVKAALFYNDLIDHMGLSRDVPKILHGQKIKWVYLKQNEFGAECIAMKADGTDPDEILEFIEKFADKRAMYNYELKDKLGDFYNVLSWEYPTETAVKCATFFEF